MGRIARLLLVLVVGGIPAAIFTLYMLLPGLGEFTTYPTTVMVAYVGCAIGALLMGPLGLLFAALSKSGPQAVAAPAVVAAADDSSDDISMTGDGIETEGFGDDAFDDGGDFEPAPIDDDGFDDDGFDDDGFEDDGFEESFEDDDEFVDFDEEK